MVRLVFAISGSSEVETAIHLFLLTFINEISLSSIFGSTPLFQSCFNLRKHLVSFFIFFHLYAFFSVYEFLMASRLLFVALVLRSTFLVSTVVSFWCQHNASPPLILMNESTEFIGIVVMICYCIPSYTLPLIICFDFASGAYRAHLSHFSFL